MVRPMAAEDAQLPRKLAAILYADVAGYSRLTGEDEEGTHRQLSTYLDLLSESVRSHNGSVVHYAGDAVLAEFPTATEALTCAVSAQKTLQEKNRSVSDERKVEFRIGVNLGEVIVDRDDIYGDGVNVAARLESLAEPGGICISESVRSAVGTKLSLTYEDLGRQTVKNIADPVQAYRVHFDPNIPKRARRPRRALVLTGIAAAVLVVVGSVLGWLKLWERGVEPEPVAGITYTLPDKPSIAVLPFDNLSGDAKYDRFVDGITEDLISDLARYPELFVIARNSTFVYKDKAVNVREVARDLGVQYVLEGSIQAAEGRVRVTAQVIDALTGRHVWTEQYDRPLDDVFAVQDEVVGKVSAALVGAEGVLADAGREVARRKPPASLSAYELNLLGVEHKHKFTAEDNREAKRLFFRAIELDPGFARAYVNLSWVTFNDAMYGWVDSPEESMQEHFGFANKAVELDDTDPEAHAALGYGYAYVKSNLERAEAEFDRALKLGPNHADTLMDIGWTVGTLFGKGREGFDITTRALRLNPHYPDWYEIPLETAAYYAREFKQAIAASQRVHSHVVETRLYAALSYAQLGDPESAARELEELMELDSEFSAKKWLGLMPHPNPEAEALFLEGARMAGLPDK